MLTFKTNTQLQNVCYVHRGQGKVVAGNSSGSDDRSTCRAAAPASGSRNQPHTATVDSVLIHENGQNI